MFVLAMVFMNAVNRPYRETSEVLRALQRDGIMFFSVSASPSFSGQYAHSPCEKQVHLTMSFVNLLFAAFGSVSADANTPSPIALETLIDLSRPK